METNKALMDVSVIGIIYLMELLRKFHFTTNFNSASNIHLEYIFFV